MLQAPGYKKPTNRTTEAMAAKGEDKKFDKDVGRFAMSNQPDNVTVEKGRKNCTVVGAVNGSYIAKVLADRAEPQIDGDCEDLGRRLMWLLGWECQVAALKRPCRAGGLFFFFSLKRKGKTVEAAAVPRVCVRLTTALALGLVLSQRSSAFFFFPAFSVIQPRVYSR